MQPLYKSAGENEPISPESLTGCSPSFASWDSRHFRNSEHSRYLVICRKRQNVFHRLIFTAQFCPSLHLPGGKFWVPEGDGRQMRDLVMLSGLHSLHLSAGRCHIPKSRESGCLFLCLYHPDTCAALQISMHPDDSQPPSLAPCRSCCLRPTGCAAHYLRTFLKSFLRSACSILQIEWTSVLCTGVTTQIKAAAIFPVANSNISRDNFSHSIFIK